MPYVLRSNDGSVQAVSQTAIAAPGWEEVESGAHEYIAYLDNALTKEDKFRESDIQLARVLEDLISILIDKDYIHFTDFPDPAQKKLIERQGFRSGKSHLNLLDDDDNY